MTTRWLMGATAVPPRLKATVSAAFIAASLALVGVVVAAPAPATPCEPGGSNGVTVDTNDPMPPEEPGGARPTVLPPRGCDKHGPIVNLPPIPAQREK